MVRSTQLSSQIGSDGSEPSEADGGDRGGVDDPPDAGRPGGEEGRGRSLDVHPVDRMWVRSPHLVDGGEVVVRARAVEGPGNKGHEAAVAAMMMASVVAAITRQSSATDA